MARKLKDYISGDLERSLNVDAGFVAVDYIGLDAAETFELRNTVREAGGNFKVVPNRLAFRVLEARLNPNGEADALRGLLRGSTAILTSAQGQEDEILSASKALFQWRKKNAEKITIKGGYVGGAYLDESQVMTLATLPDRQTLLSQVAGLFQGPIRDAASVTREILARMVYALDAYREKLEKEGGGGE